MFKEIRKEFKIISLSTYYAIQREMLNKASFLSNVIFMILNNLSMIIQWVVLFNLKRICCLNVNLFILKSK